jgi:hypothetical protein
MEKTLAERLCRGKKNFPEFRNFPEFLTTDGKEFRGWEWIDAKEGICGMGKGI